MGVCNCKHSETTEAETIPPGNNNNKRREEQRIIVNVVSARGLHGTDWFPTADRFIYCTLKAEDEELFRTQAVKDTLTPVWREQVAMPVDMSSPSLEIGICDADADGEGTELGHALLDVSPDGFNGELEMQKGDKPTGAYLKLKTRVVEKDYPREPLVEFTFVVDNPLKGPLGLDVDVHDGHSLFVTAVEAGPVQTRNEQTDTSMRVQPGDFIIKVNGQRGSSARLLDALKASTHLQLVVRRPMEFEVAVDAHDASSPRGVSIKKGCGEAVVVAEVEAGPVKAWNQANPDFQVRAGDRIVAVNGEKGKAGVLMQKFKASRCHITVVRPAEPEKSAARAC